MSVYRTLHEGVPSEVNVSAVARRGQQSNSPATEDKSAIAGNDATFARKAAPNNQPFPATFKWIASLPREIRPLALLQQYPRIANMLAQSWHDPSAFREYMFDLLIDRRGGRQGFPQDVRAELLRLRAYFDHIHPHVGTIGRQNPE
ncbi:MAG TPA: hypothetical protein VGL25_10920 [Casimicrobiaceae bacterium]|jgi:hypothetical protein